MRLHLDSLEAFNLVRNRPLIFLLDFLHDSFFRALTFLGDATKQKVLCLLNDLIITDGSADLCAQNFYVYCDHSTFVRKLYRVRKEVKQDL